MTYRITSFTTITIKIILSERHLEVNVAYIANDTIEENEDNDH